MSEITDNYMPAVSSSVFLCMADLDISHKMNPSISESDNRFPVIAICPPVSLRYVYKNERKNSSRFILHHSVSFYFTVLSEPSQDSSLMKKNISVPTYIIRNAAKIYNPFFIKFLLFLFRLLDQPHACSLRNRQGKDDRLRFAV